MGRRKFFLPTQNKRQTVVPDDVKMNNFDEIKKESFECPNCAKIIYPPYPPNLGQLIKSLKDQETQHDKEKQEEYKSYVAQCKEKGETPLPFLTEPLEIDINQKKNICRVHKIELKYKPMAKEKGYPEHIDFNLIDKRIMSFQGELKSIIDKSLPSSFLDNALKRFEKLGTKARNTDEVLKTFEAYLPGYYGNKGSDKMMDTLNRLFLQTDYMNNEKAAPLTVVEFLQQVLVPECGIRLIREDKQNKITLEEAKSIMSESQEYGSTVYFSVDVDNKKE
ncbi:RTC4-like domain-containing protein [Cokeromyces recurvatus]|uniref:RTC4-like domain-containing protein n=1 Tax=Cokeromyces recurvatus TaxID=90255 RepID=UPI00222082D5|nr:RTC4-like domain-containing protein [Cokeromyces recurvatus]KAI7901479.1 RTC4-like domain-containing protein [Cokeromyces recurvatus]